jgi:hypothetical protein
MGLAGDDKTCPELLKNTTVSDKRKSSLGKRNIGLSLKSEIPPTAKLFPTSTFAPPLTTTNFSRVQIPLAE